MSKATMEVAVSAFERLERKRHQIEGAEQALHDAMKRLEPGDGEGYIYAPYCPAAPADCSRLSARLREGGARDGDAG